MHIFQEVNPSLWSKLISQKWKHSSKSKILLDSNQKIKFKKTRKIPQK